MRYIDVNTLVPGEGTMTTTLRVRMRGEGKMPEGEHDATVVEVRGPGRPQLFEDGGQRVGPLLISTKQHRAVSRLSLSSGKSFNAVLRRAIALGLRRMVWDAKYAGKRGGPGNKHALAEELQFEVRQHLEAYRANFMALLRDAAVDAAASGSPELATSVEGGIGVLFDHIEADWSQTLVEGGYPL